MKDSKISKRKNLRAVRLQLARSTETRGENRDTDGFSLALEHAYVILPNSHVSAWHHIFQLCVLLDHETQR